MKQVIKEGQRILFLNDRKVRWGISIILSKLYQYFLLHQQLHFLYV